MLSGFIYPEATGDDAKGRFIPSSSSRCPHVVHVASSVHVNSADDSVRTATGLMVHGPSSLEAVRCTHTISRSTESGVVVVVNTKIAVIRRKCGRDDGTNGVKLRKPGCVLFGVCTWSCC